ncbi:MAG TPA: Hsp20/alpha crystallin family protein [Bryobacteraceae bacterium]|nr:Hsp20/alpha crystallin family protein [Bryobacteraceae bacterium]
MIKFAPFSDVDEMPAMRHLQDSLTRFFEPAARPWTPTVDILETENELVLKMDVPGIELKDIDIQLENSTLTIKGERRFEHQSNGKGYHRIERSYGAFARTFTLPNTLNTEDVRADYRNGVLNVTLPKKELAKPRSIKVEVSNN